jgi:hypothetical protein
MNKEIPVKLSSIAYELNLLLQRTAEEKPMSRYEQSLVRRVIEACEQSLEIIYANRDALDEAQSRFQDNGGF